VKKSVGEKNFLKRIRFPFALFGTLEKLAQRPRINEFIQKGPSKAKDYHRRKTHKM
jgi:hypothetical protein